MPAQHTPGPWVAMKLLKTDVHEYDIDHEVSGKRRRIARVFGGTSGIGVHENAALIAAAPDLLDAAKGALDALYDWSETTDSFCEECSAHAPKDRDGHITGPIDHATACRIGRLAQAIAQAKGKAHP